MESLENLRAVVGTPRLPPKRHFFMRDALGRVRGTEQLAFFSLELPAGLSAYWWHHPVNTMA